MTGTLTSAVYALRLERNIALPLIDMGHAVPGAGCEVVTPPSPGPAPVAPKPFHDPGKRLAGA